MTTPTKEQIEIMFENMPCYWFGQLPEDRQTRIDFIKVIISEWKKIRDLDARVEQMCKNNPGIKDFEDFNKAINSPK